ncbi:MAG: radical SAM protein [Methanothrix sp.]|jgi:wyosine [tRNA(Phe)-imidazoG37] synthetase (radical SAM superfamily)|uniref:Radical SAM domain protein n=2 Tax=Methanothrix TaxID=2222 RepID=A0B6M9_METTP|nr:Radical SAM domain protein [Methanothrix thermoacetophila PT]MBC7080561.1 radical SAM protein [Methanothrix sp.]NPU87621.1 radical SAM protein [Methanothrix sp.]
MIAFGPVPSRRLGMSLGVNNIPPKICTYSCIYCQVGRTLGLSVERRGFYPPARVLNEVERKISDAGDVRVDYITFVPDGEPTLDLNIGKEIDLLRTLGLRVAVISNASLLWRPDVREDLMSADLVSIKIDAADDGMWRRINRPHHSLKLRTILDGIREFAADYSGRLITESMLIKDMNDCDESLRGIAEFLSEISPATTYLSAPIRPPAERWVLPPVEERLNAAYQIMSEFLDHVELLVSPESDLFVSSGDVGSDILSITAVHPMREVALRDLLARRGEDWMLVERLLKSGTLMETTYRGEKFYIRRIESS